VVIVGLWRFLWLCYQTSQLPDNYLKNSWCSRLGLTLVGFSDVDGVLKSFVCCRASGRPADYQEVGWLGWIV
jgi:hypothetical protein